jgi:hypothetical protein
MDRSTEPWPKGDLLFLQHQLREGMSVEEVARFLNRTEVEVRAKAASLVKGNS